MNGMTKQLIWQIVSYLVLGQSWYYSFPAGVQSRQQQAAIFAVSHGIFFYSSYLEVAGKKSF